MGQGYRCRASLFQPAYYQIRVACELDDRWADWFEGLTFTRPGRGETMLSGRIQDQAALHGVLARIRDLGWSLIALNRACEPDEAVQDLNGSEECEEAK